MLVFNLSHYIVLLFSWVIPNLDSLLRYIMAYWILEPLWIWIHYWGTSCVFKLFSCSQLQWGAGVKHVPLHCWAFINLSTLPEFTLPYYFAELFLFLLPCWDIPNPNASLVDTLSHYNAEHFSILIHCWSNSCVFTLLNCSQSWKIAVLYPDLLHCSALPNPNILLSHILFHYFVVYPLP